MTEPNQSNNKTADNGQNNRRKTTRGRGRRMQKNDDAANGGNQTAAAAAAAAAANGATNTGGDFQVVQNKTKSNNNNNNNRSNNNSRGRRPNNNATNNNNNNNAKRNTRNNNRGPANNNTNNNSNNRPPQQQQQQRKQLSSKPIPLPPQAPPKQNGEKGADAHTVSEADRIRWTQTLLELREQGATLNPKEALPKLAFPATLTNTERKFVHQLASQLGLVSKSTGKGDARHISVTLKQTNMIRNIMGTTNNDDDDDDGIMYDDVSNIPLLQVGPQAVRALEQHMQRHPPSPTELLESRETGSSLALAMQQQSENASNNTNNNNNNTTVIMDLLADGDRATSRTHQSRPKRNVNLDRRRQAYVNHQTRKRQQTQAYERMIQQRSQLPAYAHQQEIIDTVHEHAVTIISGPTGCGKSTQVPQFLLDDPRNDAANMVVTQPRRLAAIAIAERVAEEQLQTTSNNSNNNDNWIGYQVRLESNKSDQTQVLFLTPGVLLRQLQSDPLLTSYTHIVMDEIHERDKYQEFLLIVLRDLLPKRPELRLVLMSATLQTMELVEYFSTYDNLQPPAVIEMEGRTFPVEPFFLEQVLDMTKYIQVEEVQDGGSAGNGEAHMIASAMTTEQLEAELARFAGGESSDAANHEVGEEALQCALCQRTDFVDESDLLGHVMVCTGNPDESVHEDYDTTVATGPLFGSINDYNSKNNHVGGGDAGINDMEFEEYDVDEDLQYQDEAGDSLRVARPTAPVSQEAVDEVKDGSKWDGLSPFREVSADDAVSELMVTKKEDALLTQYQAMHDDETIDYYLLLHALQYIVESSYGDGAILVFLPGWQEISEFSLLLEVSAPFSNRNRYLILPLHSGIQSRDQRKVLQRPPRGMRKIVLSTNLAETSLTIDDVAFVVDTGRAKEKNYDPHLKTSTLQPTWISQASAKQRMGRAGRTKAGVCFHLFSKRRYQFMRPFVESELLRTPLEEMCLMCKKLGLAPGGCEDDDGVPAFLAKAMSTPHAKSVTNALELLVDLGAMQPETNDLTNLGDCLSMLSLEPRVGKMVIWSYLLGCSRVASNMAVAMSYKSPFTLPPNHLRKAADEAKVRMSQGSESDQLTVHFALEYREQYFRNNKNNSGYNDFCRRSFLSPATMQMVSDMRKNLIRELSMIGLPSPSMTSQQSRNQNNNQNYHNRHDNDHALWQAAIAAGLYPNVASRQRDDVNFSTMTNQKVKVHISSVNAVRGQPLNAKCQIPKGQVEFVCFGEMVKGTAQFFTVNQTAHLASPLPLLLLCGTSLSVRPVRLPPPTEDCQANNKSRGRNAKNKTNTVTSPQDMALLSMDDWIVFQCDAGTAANIVILRKRLENAFWNALKNPKAGGKNMLQSLTQVERDAVEIVGAVLQSAHYQSEKAKGMSPAQSRR